MKSKFLAYVGAAFALLAPGTLCAQSIYATPYTFRILAGSSSISGATDGPGEAARFFAPCGLAVDKDGNIFVADTQNMTIRRITKAGVVTTIAGKPGRIAWYDGAGTDAGFAGPSGVAVDAAGNVYVADTYNSTIRKISSAGDVTTLAGFHSIDGSADGVGSAARFFYPTGVAVDASGSVYVSDSYNCTIRKVSGAGVVTTLAGLAGSWGSADGPGSTARFAAPMGLAVDSAGNVYVADSYNCTIRKISSAGVVTTLAGSAGFWGSTDGIGSSALFAAPGGVAVDGAGNVYVADTGNNTIRKISSGGVVTTLAGKAGVSASVSGTGSGARFCLPSGIALDSAGTLFVADGDRYDTYVAGINSNVIRTSSSTAVDFASAPAITVQPDSHAIANGSPAVLTVSASGSPAPSYQWYRNGAPLAGATGTSLTVSRVDATSAGNYWAVATNNLGTVTSVTATLSVAPVGTTASYLRALALRFNVSVGADAPIVGFVLEGSGGNVLVKAIGPSIAAAPLSVPGTLADPKLEIIASSTGQTVASNDNWGGAADIVSADRATGSFPLADGASRDAAVVRNLSAGNYSASISGVGGGTGIALVEFYGVDTPANLKALSFRGRIGAGADAAIIGFVVEGSTSRTVLIKAVGPGIAAAPGNVPGALADPQLELLPVTGGAPHLSNDDWGGAAEITAANAAAGAFPLSDSNSRDAAMLATLHPGVYIVTASGVNGTTGVALVEIYGM